MKAILFAGLTLCAAGWAGAGERQPGKQPQRGERLARMTERLDTDKDGRVSRAEFLAGHELGDRLDRNGDGVITADELSGGEQGSQQGGQRGGQRLKAWFERADADHDGKLTAAERSAARERMFDRLDTNRDGFLDASDRPAGNDRL